MTVKEYQKIAYGEWFDYVDPADAKRAHTRNGKDHGAQRSGSRPLNGVLALRCGRD